MDTVFICCGIDDHIPDTSAVFLVVQAFREGPDNILAANPVFGAPDEFPVNKDLYGFTVIGNPIGGRC